MSMGLVLKDFFDLHADGRLQSLTQRSIAIVLCAFATPGICSDAASGTISYLLSIPAVSGIQPSVFLFKTSGARTAQPPCSTTDLWVIDGSTAAGQQTIATVLSAQAQGKQVTVHGTGSCTIWGDTESASSVGVLP